MKFFQPVPALLLFGMAFMLASKASASASSPLPPLETVLQRVMETSSVENAEYHKFNSHYFYTRDKVTEFYDGGGNLRERKEKQTTNNPAPPLIVPTLVPDPAPTVSPRKEGPKADPPNVHGVALGKKEDLMNPDIVRRFKFTLVGRDTIKGRPALIVDFAPVSDSLPILNIKDRFINSVEGRAWVDEQDFTLEKVDLHLKRKVSVLGGVAGSVSKFSFSFDRERTPDGFWFMRDMNWHVEAREATVQRTVDHTELILGVQKIR